MVFPPSAKSNCALIFSKFNCPIEVDWAVWALTVELPACVPAYVKFFIKPSLNISAVDVLQVTWFEPRTSCGCSFFLRLDRKENNLPSSSFCICQAALNLASGVYLLYVLAGVSLLNEGEQDCQHPEDGAAQPPGVDG